MLVKLNLKSRPGLLRKGLFQLEKRKITWTYDMVNPDDGLQWTSVLILLQFKLGTRSVCALAPFWTLHLDSLLHKPR